MSYWRTITNFCTTECSAFLKMILGAFWGVILRSGALVWGERKNRLSAKDLAVELRIRGTENTLTTIKIEMLVKKEAPLSNDASSQSMQTYSNELDQRSDQISGCS